MVTMATATTTTTASPFLAVNMPIIPFGFAGFLLFLLCNDDSIEVTLASIVMMPHDDQTFGRLWNRFLYFNILFNTMIQFLPFFTLH